MTELPKLSDMQAGQEALFTGPLRDFVARGMAAQKAVDAVTRHQRQPREMVAIVVVDAGGINDARFVERLKRFQKRLGRAYKLRVLSTKEVGRR